MPPRAQKRVMERDESGHLSITSGISIGLMITIITGVFWGAYTLSSIQNEVKMMRHYIEECWTVSDQRAWENQAIRQIPSLKIPNVDDIVKSRVQHASP